MLRLLPFEILCLVQGTTPHKAAALKGWAWRVEVDLFPGQLECRHGDH